jgi:hypothetical protein
MAFILDPHACINTCIAVCHSTIAILFTLNPFTVELIFASCPVEFTMTTHLVINERADVDALISPYKFTHSIFLIMTPIALIYRAIRIS